MTAKTYNFSAYTLVEMLVVLAIFSIIALIGFASFYGFKDAVTLNEETLSLEQDIRYAQRAALFLERKTTDRWLYGIGLDFSDLETTGKYNLFKWCSPFNDYGDPKTKGDIPNYDTGTISAVNGNIPVSAYSFTDCPLDSAVSQLSKLNDTGDSEISSNFSIELPIQNYDVQAVSKSPPQYLLFEAVSGRAFFYDSTGVVSNYYGSALMVDSPINFSIEITSPRTNTKKTILISNISGKVEIQTTKTN